VQDPGDAHQPGDGEVRAVSRFLARRLLARSREEQGFVLVLFALLMVALLGVAAVVVDLGQQRSSRRSAQAIADLAALGGGKSLSAGDPGQACVDAITYLNMNVQDLSPKITASTFCTSTLQTSRTAIVKMTNSIGSRIPALWLLDPYGCTPLSISGGAQLTLGDASASPPIPGVATIDSDGTQCSQNQDTLMVGGSG